MESSELALNSYGSCGGRVADDGRSTSSVLTITASCDTSLATTSIPADVAATGPAAVPGSDADLPGSAADPAAEAAV